jgi:hypothetical protein
VVAIVERGHCNKTREANETAANANSDDTVRTDIYESDKEGGTHPRAELERRCVYAFVGATPRRLRTTLLAETATDPRRDHGFKGPA